MAFGEINIQYIPLKSKKKNVFYLLGFIGRLNVIFRGFSLTKENCFEKASGEFEVQIE